jgi:hypothetical protein
MKFLIFFVLLVIGCAPDNTSRVDYFWYPIELEQVTCPAYKGTVYKMMNSKGWRSWTYYLDASYMYEVDLPATCVFVTIKKYPIYECADRSRSKLTDEQKVLIIEGF